MPNPFFESVAVPERPSSQFNGDNVSKFTTRIGDVTPNKCIPYYAGDKFNISVSTAVNFPPLLAPAYQKLSLRQYIFKVRKGLTWNNESLGKYLTSTTDGSLAPKMPFINNDKMYWHGSIMQGWRFHPHLPVFGRMQNGRPWLAIPTAEMPLSVNHFIFYILIGETMQGTKVDFSNWFSFDVTDRFFKNELPSVGNTNGFYHFYKESDSDMMHNKYSLFPAAYTGFTDPTKYNETMIDGTRYIAPLGRNAYPKYFDVAPLGRIGGLMDYLDYDKSNYRDRDWLLSHKPDTHNASMQGIFTDMENGDYNSFFTVSQLSNRVGDTDTIGRPYLQTTTDTVILGGVPIVDVMQAYAEWCIVNNFLGSNMPDDGDCPFFDIKPLNFNLFHPNYGVRNYEAGRFIGFWRIYSDYFRDASLTSEIDFTAFRADGAEFNDWIDSNPLLNASFRADYDGEVLNSYYTDDPKALAFAREYLRVKYTSLPRKMMDRQFLTSLLPSTSVVQVFAPTLDRSAVQSLANNPVTVPQNAGQQVKPLPLIPIPQAGESFISVDAWRTAEVLQQFYKEATLCGNKPVQFVLMVYGVHSQDFRMEMPELISANDTPISITEVSQASETAELPLGSEAGKMYAVTNRDKFHIDSNGDFGYIYSLCVVYPHVNQTAGIDLSILDGDPWDTLFLPQFAELGEEKVINGQAYSGLVEGFNTGGYPTTGRTYDATKVFGYTPRYSRFKFIPDTVHGRFRTDLNYWTLDRISSPLDALPKLNQKFITTPLDLRLFASDEIENVYGISVFNIEFERKLPSLTFTPIA